MKQLKQRGVLLLALVAVFSVAAVSVHAATLNVTVMDAQAGEKLEGISITVMSKPVFPMKVSVMHPVCSKLQIWLPVSTRYPHLPPVMPIRPWQTLSLLPTEPHRWKLLSLQRLLNWIKFPFRPRAAGEKVLEAPASVALVSASEIKDRVAPSVTEHLKSVRGWMS